VYGFPYPLTLCVIHMAFCSAVSYVLVAVLKWVPLEAPIEHDVYLRSVVPIGGLYALSLWCSNAAYMYLSVASIQMTKALMPVSVFVVGVGCGLEQYSHAALLNMLLITVGVSVASLGVMNFQLQGFLVQLAAIACESTRLAFVQMFLQKQGLKLNPITTMYYLAPACFMFLSLPCAFLEAQPLAHDAHAVMSVSVLGGSAVAAFALNLSIYLLIGETSALTMNVAGVIKDWALIYLSAFYFGSVVTKLSLHGYFVALVGVCIYNYRKFSAAVTSLDTAGTDIEVAKQSVLIHDFKEFSDFRSFARAKREAAAAGSPAASKNTLGLFASGCGGSLRWLFGSSKTPENPKGETTTYVDDAAQALLIVREASMDSLQR